MVTVITHITLKPTLPQAVFAIYSTARSKDVSEETSRNIREETEEQGWPMDGTVTNFVCLAVKLLSELANPKASKHAEEIQVFHIIEFYPCCHGLDNHSTSTSSLRRALGSILCPWLGAAVQVSGQNLWPGTTPCQQPLSDSCCCLTNLRSWEKSTKSQADSLAMTRQARTGVSACSTHTWRSGQYS